MILCSQGNLRVMQKFNILKKLYRQSPMDFYTKNQDSTGVPQPRVGPTL